MGASERRMEIIERLCERRFDTIGNLANEFRVSRNTIKNDILILSYSYPLYTIQGNGGGVRLVDGYRLGMKYMTSKQTDLLEKLSETLSGEELATMQSILKTFSNPIK